MESCYIIEAVENGIESVLYKQWHHEGYIDGMGSNQIQFVLDGKRYVLRFEESEETK